MAISSSFTPVEEGVTDSELNVLCEELTAYAAINSSRTVFGKPRGNDYRRLRALLNPQLTELLRRFGMYIYDNVLGHKLYHLTAAAVDRRYCVGAASGLLRLTDKSRITADPGSALLFMKNLETILQPLTGEISQILE